MNENTASKVPLSITADTAVYHATERRAFEKMAIGDAVQAAEKKRDVKAIELVHECDIAAAQTTDGKDLYSSDVKRKAELALRLHNDDDYQHRIRAIDDLARDIDLSKADARYHADMLAVILAFATNKD